MLTGCATALVVQVGLMVNDMTVENMLVAAPAFLVCTVVLDVEHACKSCSGSMTLFPSHMMDGMFGTDMT